MATLKDTCEERLRLKIYEFNPNALIQAVTIGDLDDAETWNIDFYSEMDDAARQTVLAYVRSLSIDDLINVNDADRVAMLASRVETLLVQIGLRQTQIDNRRAVVTADLSALAAANTNQFKAIVGRILSAEDDSLAADKRELDVLAKLVCAVRRMV